MDTILITGGTGFFGRNLALRLRSHYNIILCGRNSFFNDYARRTTGCQVLPLDILNQERLKEVINICKPDIIIHAAATKYVDLAEVYPEECIDINIKGSQHIVRAVHNSGVKFVLGISTDKAALPCNNIYGMSKNIMEKTFLHADKQSPFTKLSCVRPGNIAWSTGSVLPLWKTMLAETGRIQTTGSHMRRFICAIDDACKMVTDALDNQDMIRGSVLTKRMKGISIAALLDRFVALHGGTYEKVPPRPGESTEQFIIGADEVDRTTIITLNNTEYLLINNTRVAIPHITECISTTNCETLSDDELLDIINPLPNSYI
ncbi:NAD-dependent epimerase/dehydratase family protein [Chitinophaga agrisoli]|uniref:NAD-dependent epimerase/dehydratase family protein n=1 Tax=Chitinophaga agrisoli TaxID=2607653 RepID=A0A5B2VML2_9BACT|nr:polysaccharide biosynthesis protein [Chitinophaga agrisoli]KAA2239399.1 NAD-dependent epimerase/dehydratase family protein [Chitinophaga agrisoli]